MDPKVNEKIASVLSGQPLPSVADGTSVVTNRIVTVKKANKNLNLRVETVSDPDNRPSENNVGQLTQAYYTARDGSVICNDNICVDEVDGDLDLSVCVKKS